MKLLIIKYYIKKLLSPAVVFILITAVLSPGGLRAQPANRSSALNNNNGDGSVNRDFVLSRDFRVERFPVQGGAEIITIFASLKGLTDSPEEEAEEVPLISILRDTLGDQTIENDRLRYVWMLTYAKPSFSQKVAAAIPFLYLRTANKEKVGDKLPPPVIDLNPVKNQMWNKIFWVAFRSLMLSDFGVPVKAATLQYKTNQGNYRKSAVARSLAILALYEAIEGEKVLSDGEMQDIQARLSVSGKMFGSMMQDENLERVYQKNVESIRDLRGHNWELLRQYSEAQGLYFEPLEMPDGSATHALVWVSADDLAANKDKNFDGRFLNIKNPWNDSRLLKWNGYSEERWFDANHRLVEPDAPDAKPKQMIPLALYGLDYPKIPTLLVDFRDRENPKGREMSRRVLDDLTKNVLSVSRFSNLPYFFGRYVYDFVTGKRGMDLNQATRLRSYSQLKLLLSLNASLEPDFRDVIARRLESVSLNPLENNLDVEVKVARRQYDNLIAYAKSPDGLPAQLEKERRKEMTRLKHSSTQRAFYDLGRVVSFGIYTHREKDTPELRAEMDLRRQLDYHERYLRETANRSARIEVDGDPEAVRRSLLFISQNGSLAQAKTATAVAKMFSITEDEQIKELALKSLYRIDNSTAKKELLALYETQTLETRWRDLCAQYLKLAVKEEQRISSNDLKVIAEIGGGQ